MLKAIELAGCLGLASLAVHEIESVAEELLSDSPTGQRLYAWLKRHLDFPRRNT